jgi:hypothetical protein
MAVRILVGLLFVVHGVSHGVGFVVPWKLATMAEEPYKTTLLAGAVDVGDLGVRVVGVLWLLAGLGYCLAAIGVFALLPWWRDLALWLTVASLVLCILGLPGAKIGIAVDVAILAFLLIERRYGWLAAAT